VSESRWRRWLPVALMLVLVMLSGYPMALIFGLPLARRDMNDLRKWTKATVVAQPPTTLPSDAVAGSAIAFSQPTSGGVLVQGGSVIATAEEFASLRFDAGALVSDAAALERIDGRTYRTGIALDPDDPLLAIYVDSERVLPGSELADERPDGQRLDFTFAAASGPVAVDGRAPVEGRDYVSDGATVIFVEPPAFGSAVRRLTGDFLVLDGADGTLLFAEPPEGSAVVATGVVRLAERLEGPADGSNRTFSLASANVLDGDDERRLYLGDRLLSAEEERPDGRVDGERTVFTFASPPGIVTLAGAVLTEGRDYALDGDGILFSSPPPRNARLRNNPDYALIEPATGTIALARAPDPGAILWAESYTVNAHPSCGDSLYACFLNLPQHPVPYPHWIAERIGPFVSKFALTDERNVVWATLYTSLGTLAALALGGAVGILLAVVFVLFRPLEQALLPWVIASQTVPIIALVPVLLLVLGNFGITIQTSLLPTAIIGAYIAFFPVVVGTVKGLRSVDPLALDLMRSYAASPLQLFVKVRFPAAVPFFFTSLKLGTAAALVGALVAETESNNRRGLGFQILGQVQSGNVADVWILLIVSGLLGIGLVALVGLLERLLAPWRRT
jgi:NitT/TauT family transport system permease protein